MPWTAVETSARTWSGPRSTKGRRAQVFQLVPFFIDGRDAQVGAAEVHADGQIMHVVYLVDRIIANRFNETIPFERDRLANFSPAMGLARTRAKDIL